MPDQNPTNTPQSPVPDGGTAAQPASASQPTAADASRENAIIDDLRMPPRRMMETYVPVKKSGDQAETLL